MLSKLMPLVFLVLGCAAGIGTGLVLAPDSDPGGRDAGTAQTEVADRAAETEYVKLNNQFVIPVVLDERIEALVVVSLSLETTLGIRETVYAREPKLRDAFLRVLFDHANMGGFSGAFTQAERLDPLRAALREVARQELGADVRDVLIVDIARQDA